MQGVENSECGKCGVWKMRAVENVECGKYVENFNFPFQFSISISGEMQRNSVLTIEKRKRVQGVENSECGKCGLWKMWSVENT